MEGNIDNLGKSVILCFYVTHEPALFKDKLFFITEIKCILLNGVYRHPIIT